MKFVRHFVAAAALLAAGSSAARADVIYANNLAPGDSFTNAGPSNQGQAVGTSGWYYNNVRNSGEVGIDTTYGRSGNGSVHFSSPSGAAKADIEYLSGGTEVLGNFYATTSLGLFSDLTSLSYEWYVSSSSTTAGHLHPSMRIMLDGDGQLNTINDRGYLIFERIYNGGTPFATDTWNADAITSTTNLWNAGFGAYLPNQSSVDGNANGYDDTLADWQQYFSRAVILGFSSGVGSGWNGVFDGAIDNVNWTIGTVATTNNFEVQSVPEPAILTLLGVGLAYGSRRLRNRR